MRSKQYSKHAHWQGWTHLQRLQTRKTLHLCHIIGFQELPGHHSQLFYLAEEEDAIVDWSADEWPAIYHQVLQIWCIDRSDGKQLRQEAHPREKHFNFQMLQRRGDGHKILQHCSCWWFENVACPPAAFRWVILVDLTQPTADARYDTTPAPYSVGAPTGQQRRDVECRTCAELSG
jgi:hypothetical protein